MAAFEALDLLSQGFGGGAPRSGAAACSSTTSSSTSTSTSTSAYNSDGSCMRGGPHQQSQQQQVVGANSGSSSGSGSSGGCLEGVGGNLLLGAASGSGAGAEGEQEGLLLPKESPLCRPISAPPNLGFISASTLFAYPPVESAECVDFLLNDIRYDEQYCEFYRTHVRDNPSLPKPLEEVSSLLELPPRFRTRDLNAKETDGSAATAATAAAAAAGGGGVGGAAAASSTQRRGDALAAAAAALLRQTNAADGQAPAAAAASASTPSTQGEGAAAPTSEINVFSVSAASQRPASVQQQQQQQQGRGWSNACMSTSAAAASRAGAGSAAHRGYPSSSSDRGLLAGEHEAGAEFVAADLGWCRAAGNQEAAFCSELAEGFSSRLSKSSAASASSNPPLQTTPPAATAAAAAAAAAGDLAGAPVGLLLGSAGPCAAPPPLGLPLLRPNELSGFSYPAAAAAFDGFSQESLAAAAAQQQHRSLLDAQQAAAAASWLLSRQPQGPTSLAPLAAAQRAAAAAAAAAATAAANPVAAGGGPPLGQGPRGDAWLLPGGPLRLQGGGGDLGGLGATGSLPLSEQLHRRQLSLRHLREQRRRTRAEGGSHKKYSGPAECWEAQQQETSRAAFVGVGRGMPPPLLPSSGGPRGGRGGAAAAPGAASAAAGLLGRYEQTATAAPGGASGGARLSAAADVLQADDDSLFKTAKDQGGCRLLQRLLVEGSPAEVERLFSLAFSRVVELMTDAYGNYLFQNLLDVCSDKQLEKLLFAIKPHLRDICLDPHGTRTAQKLVEVICGSRQCPSLTAGLIAAFKPLVVDLATNANGSHVVKRFLWCTNRDNNKNTCSIDFILEAACEHCVQIATERHGCCVLQRCCEAASGPLKERLLSEVSSNALLLSQDPFGNYVVQHILRHDHARVGSAIIEQLRGHVRELSEQKFASNVVEKCLLWGEAEQRAQLIEELLEEPQELQELVLHAYGNYVVQRALAVAGATQRDALLEVVRFSLMHQHTSQHSRIAHKLMRRFRGLRPPPGVGPPAGSTGACVAATAAPSTSGSTASWCCPPGADSAAQLAWDDSAADHLNISVAAAGSGTSLTAAAGLQVKALCRQQQRQQQQSADAHAAIKRLSGDGFLKNAEFGGRPVSPLQRHR
ncbi:hypothetical protein Esti_001008 [Eimeria stiedai]